MKNNMLTFLVLVFSISAFSNDEVIKFNEGSATSFDEMLRNSISNGKEYQSLLYMMQSDIELLKNRDIFIESSVLNYSKDLLNSSSSNNLRLTTSLNLYRDGKESEYSEYYNRYKLSVLALDEFMAKKLSDAYRVLSDIYYCDYIINKLNFNKDESESLLDRIKIQVDNGLIEGRSLLISESIKDTITTTLNRIESIKSTKVNELQLVLGLHELNGFPYEMYKPLDYSTMPIIVSDIKNKYVYANQERARISSLVERDRSDSDDPLYSVDFRFNVNKTPNYAAKFDYQGLLSVNVNLFKAENSRQALSSANKYLSRVEMAKFYKFKYENMYVETVNSLNNSKIRLNDLMTLISGKEKLLEDMYLKYDNGNVNLFEIASIHTDISATYELLQVEVEKLDSAYYGFVGTLVRRSEWKN
ncbi:hypothetical protein [Vibrio barjaei]|uniref:hypothetical protein n=1 Tax=Vibrio barjaei TaxID=1676683 RepID=UPI00228424E4|nr:hypothetical protein [Vibrio barjaei]MCY9874831.1 hypothetical protein [Vibrio barjaei]